MKTISERIAEEAKNLNQNYKKEIEINETAQRKAVKPLTERQILANMGVKVNGYTPDMEYIKEKKRILDKVSGVEKNANEVMNTGNTGFGEELIPTDVLMQEVMDIIPNFQTFQKALPGFHGAGLDKTTTLPILGEAPLMQYNTTERSSAAANLQQANAQVGTDKVTLNQKQFLLRIDSSDEERTFNVMGAARFEQMIRNKIASSWARTEGALIINGDAETGGTGNVNSDDGAPTAGTYYLAANGLRKTAIVTDTNTLNVTALTFDDFVDSIKKLGEYASSPEDCMWLMNTLTYYEALGVTEFKDASQNAAFSTITKGAGALTNFMGSDVYINRDLPKTEADGKVSTTPGNNTVGQFLYFWKPAVQWGYGKELNLALYERGARGFQIEGWGYMGLAIIGQGDTANFSENTCMAGINVTL